MPRKILCKHHYLSGDRKGKRCRQTAKYPVRSPVVCQYHRKFQRNYTKKHRRKRRQMPQPQPTIVMDGGGLWSWLFGDDENDELLGQKIVMETGKKVAKQKAQELVKQKTQQVIQKANPRDIRAVTSAVNKLADKPVVQKISKMQPVMKSVVSGPVRRAIDSVLRRAFQLVRIGGSTGGVIASGGFAGDTIVDIILLLLPVAKLGVDVSIVGATSAEARQLVLIDFEGGPSAVEKRTETILTQLKQNPRAQDLLKELCIQFEGILGDVASTFGQIVTAFIPDDFGLAGTAAEEIIVTAGGEAYPLLRAFYDKMPELARNLLQDKKKLVRFINTMLDLLVKKDEKWWQRLGRGGLRSGLISAASLAALGVAIGSTVLFPPALPMVIAVGAGAQAGNLLFTAGVGDETTRKLIDKVLRPRIPILVEIISRSMALGFVTLRILNEC